MSGLIPEPYFPLTIKLDPDEVDWTHLLGDMQHIKTPTELPSALKVRVVPIVLWLRTHPNQQEFSLEDPQFANAPEGFLDTLHLTAWWIEWTRRRVNAHGSFVCTHCQSNIAVNNGGSTNLYKTIYRCPNRACPTQMLLTQATSEPFLELVGKTQTT